MAWVLIIWFAGPQIVTIDFNTLEACETVKAKMIKEHWLYDKYSFCAHRG